MGAFSVLPAPLLDFLYDRVAKNRYRVFGRSDACMLPPPEMRARFLP
jgi:predicted DCC family thiol-disulfide oxidoreductase YuxK